MSTQTDLAKIECLKEQIFAMSNEHCFIEKERFIAGLEPCDEKPSDYFATMLASLLDCVSTPVCENDIFVGRVVEDMPDPGMQCPTKVLFAKGHLIPDYARLLTKGYGGVLREIKANAERIGTDTARHYAENAEIVTNAVRRFAARYAEAAREKGMMRAYEALCRVPYEPAYDLYSALQSMWIY